VGGTRQRLDLSVAKVLGSAFAAVTAAVVTSFAGVAGTVVGAAVVSVVATVGTAAYTHSLNRAKERMRTVQAAQGRVRAGGAGGAGGSTTTTPAPAPSRTPRLATWAVAGAAVLVFLLSMGAVSAFELVAGRPLSSLLGRHHDRSGTSVGRVFGGGSAARKVPSKPPSTEPSTKPSPGARISPSAGPSVGVVPSPAPAPSPSGPVRPSRSPAPAPPAPSPS